MSRTTRILFFSSIGFVLIVLFQNCSKFEMNEGSKVLNLVDPAGSEIASQAKTILQNKCAGCHHSSGASNLTTVSDDAFLLSQGYIAPGSPDNSKLWQRIDDGTMPPAGSTPLTVNEKSTIYEWIEFYPTLMLKTDSAQ